MPDINIKTIDLSSELYGPERGQVKIRLVAQEAPPKKVTMLFTEHGHDARRQHVINSKMAPELTVELPAGEYTMQVAANGFETVRGLVDVNPKRPFGVDAVLNPREAKPKTFEERLAKYGIDAANTKPTNLDVKEDTTQTLNQEKDRDKKAFAVVKAGTIAEVKALVGSDDTRFGHGKSVFGALPVETLAKLRDARDLKKLSPEEVESVKLAAREYVHGNSKSVAQYEPLLNQALVTFQQATLIPVYFYRVVTIGAGATLVVGNGSAVFTCDELRIHKTGKLKPVGDVSIEIGTYTEFQ